VQLGNYAELILTFRKETCHVTPESKARGSGGVVLGLRKVRNRSGDKAHVVRRGHKVWSAKNLRPRFRVHPSRCEPLNPVIVMQAIPDWLNHGTIT
jgi:hypothetical protein